MATATGHDCKRIASLIRWSTRLIPKFWYHTSTGRISRMLAELVEIVKNGVLKGGVVGL